MKVRKGSILMLLVVLAMVFSLVAVVPTAAQSPLPPEDQWGGMPMPNTQDWNLAPGTDAGPLAMDDEGDGTLHVGVYDAWDSQDDSTNGTRWGSPRGVVRWAVFYSTDGGYDWKMGWELPEDDPGPIIDIVQAPGYEHPGWVYMITPWFLYYSSNGGEDFQRASQCPGVWDINGATGGYLTSLDITAVGECPACKPYAAVVGVACGDVDGVYAWNLEGVGLWYDMEITNYPAGAGPEGSVPVYEVRFSPNYLEDLGLWAVAYYDPSNIGSAFDTVYSTYTFGATTLVSWYDGITRTWANEYLDAPLLVSSVLGPAIGQCDYAVLDYGDDFDIDNAPQCYVGIAGTPYDDVWQVKILPPAAGPSSASRQNISGGADQPIDSIAVFGASIMTKAYVGIRDVTVAGIAGLVSGWPAQVVLGTNIYITTLPQWLRSFKNPEGRYGCWGITPNSETRDCAPADRFYTGLVFVVERSGGAEAHCSTGFTGVPSGNSYDAWNSDNDVFSGVWRLANSVAGLCWNGTGVLDDILVTSTYLDNEYVNYAEVVWEEASPDYANDDTLFFVSWSDWTEYWYDTTSCYDNGTLFFWRTTDNCESWEMLYREATRTPVGIITGMPDQWVDEYLDLEGYGPNDAIWSVRTTPQFSMAGGGDQYLFLLGCNVPAKAAPGWWLWYSLDGGDMIAPLSAMPQLWGTTYMHLGWEVFDNNTIAIGDDVGLIFITTNRANSWTDGVATHFEDDCYITDIEFSPIYSDEPGEGEDQTIIVGLYYYDYSVAEVWISNDGAQSDFTMVGTFPGYQYEWDDVSPCVVEFDLDWNNDDDTTIYAAASGLFDNWDWVYEEEGGWMLYEWGDVGIYRTNVVLNSPPVSVWEPIFDWAQLEELLPPNPDLDIRSPENTDDCYRYIWFTELEVGPDDTIYAPYTVFDDWWASSGEGRFTHGGVLRCLDGQIQPIEDVEFSNIVLGLPHWTGLYLIDAVAGTTHLFSIGYRNDFWYSDLLDMRLMGYSDTLCQAGPVVVSPTDGATGVGTAAGELEKVNVTIDWEAMASSAPIKYHWQLDTDPKFTGAPGDTEREYLTGAGIKLVWTQPLEEDITSDTYASVPGLDKGTKYYVRVRVIEPALSPWTGPIEFTTKASTITTVVTGPSIADGSPSPGATDVALRPTFSWGALGGVESYQLQVATDANFSDLVIDEDTAGTAYTPDEDLDKNTTYYWRVRGVTADGEYSDWSSTGVFTTGPEAGPAAGTPAWVWVVIVIGAILAIAVIILIVRTRKPA